MATAAGYTDKIIDDQSKLAVNEGNTRENSKAESDSLTQESDEILEMFCEHCEQELGETVKAEGFCVDCLEYMCATCLRYHQRYKPDHTIQDSANMPQDFCLQKCQDHPKELIKFYCMTCQQKACSVCKNIHQNECTIEHIPSLVKSVDLKCNVNEIIKAIENDIDVLSKSKDDVTSKLSDVQSISQNAKVSVKEHTKSLKKGIEDLYLDNINELQQKQESEIEHYEKKRADILAKLDKEKEDLMNNHQVQTKMLQDNKMITFDQIERKEEELDKQSESTKLRDETRLKMMFSKSAKIEADLDILKQNLSKKLFKNQKCEVFLAIKEAGKLLEKMKIDVEEASQHVEISNYEFQPDGLNMCKLDVNTTIGFGSFKEKTKIRTKISYFKDVPSQHPFDIWCSCITGLCKISDSYLIAADYKNRSIKLIDIDRNLFSLVNLEEEPFDVILLENDMAATTMPNARKIQLFSITQDNRMSLSSQISVPGNCYGIAFRKPNIVVRCTENIHVIGLNGIVVNTIPITTNPSNHIKLHPNGNILYTLENLANYGNIVITKLMIANKNIKRKRCKCSQPVTGLAVDKSGTIYTCTADGLYLFQISGDFSYHTSTHQVLQKQTWTPMSLFYCNKENKLYIGTGSGIIRIFKVE